MEIRDSGQISISNDIPYIIALCLFMSGIQHAFCQDRLCQGSFGTNIFTEGDFGKGSQNVYGNDPRLAPGYRYSTRMPVDDGFYTLTNDMSRWRDIFPAWIRIRDNSPDPNGYMMVVNANFEPGIFYEQMIDGLCENTAYEFSADVINLVRRNERDHILPDVSFLIDGQEAYTTGNIPQDESWKTVGFTFQTRPGQTRLRLTLRNNAPGGMGNDLALDNISFRPCGPLASIRTRFPNVICENADFPILNAEIRSDHTRVLQWQISRDQGQTWQNIRNASSPRLQVEKLTAGSYQLRFIHAASGASLANEKCHARSEVFTLIVRPAITERHETIDAGQTITIGESVFQFTGVYETVLPGSTGCDSTVILHLTVRGEQIEPTFNVSDITCFGRQDGAIQLMNMRGGEAPYLFRWDHSDSGSASQRNLDKGSYKVRITDQQGRQTEASFQISEPAPLELQTNILSVPTPQNDTGSASVTVSGGKPPYSYAWASGDTTAFASKLLPGAHEVVITDKNGCTIKATVSIPAIPEEEKILGDLTLENLLRGEAVRMERLQFEADSSRIREGFLPTLHELLSFLNENPGIRVEIGGHTNGLPDHAYCDRLSKARAKAIAVWLVGQGIDGERVFYRGYGKRQPLASNETAAGRRKNQRVEVKMIVAK